MEAFRKIVQHKFLEGFLIKKLIKYLIHNFCQKVNDFLIGSIRYYNKRSRRHHMSQARELWKWKMNLCPHLVCCMFCVFIFHLCCAIVLVSFCFIYIPTFVYYVSCVTMLFNHIFLPSCTYFFAFHTQVDIKILWPYKGNFSFFDMPNEILHSYFYVNMSI